MDTLIIVKGMDTLVIVKGTSTVGNRKANESTMLRCSTPVYKTFFLGIESQFYDLQQPVLVCDCLFQSVQHLQETYLSQLSGCTRLSAVISKAFRAVCQQSATGSLPPHMTDQLISR